MGSHLAPVLANIFMDFHESKCLKEYNNKTKFYSGYVDDILAAFDNEEDSINIPDFLNNKHPNIKFTIEKKINHSIIFLDVFISGINNQNLTLQTYHKLTYTGLILYFKSFTSFSYKVSLIKCLIDSSLKICNNSNSFHKSFHWCARKSFSSHPFTVASVPFVLLCLCLCFAIFVLFLCFSFIYHFHYLWHFLFSLSLFYSLNYTLLLLHLISTHLASHLSVLSIVFIISALIIDILYCLDYTSLLLHLFMTHFEINFIITM